ncbi:MAG: AAA family ATPase [Solirubrobacterales bacterium]
MGFLSRKKPKPAPVEIEEEQTIVDDLQEMEEAVPERARDEGARAAGPVDAGDPPPPARQEGVPPTTPPAADAPMSDAEGPAVASLEADEGSVAEEELALNAAVEEEIDGGDARMKAVDLIAPTRLDFLQEKQAAAEAPVRGPEVIAFANQKGGVAKTTTTLNLAVAFAESGYRVLCIDLDPQGNLTMSQGIDPDKVEKSLYDVLVNDMPISEIIVKREIDIAVASIDLAGAEIAMSTKIGRERSLEKALKEVAGDYDFVCIDTPPSLGLLTINALTAANKVIVPVQCEYLSMRGLVQLQNTLRMIQENLNPDVKIEGILPTMLDSRTIHAKEAVEILEENFGDLVFRSRIKKAIKFAEAPVKGASVLKYDSDSSAANYYRELAKEVLSHGSAE